MNEKGEKLWEQIYKMIRKGNVILLDKETVEKAYKHIHANTGMKTDDINLFMLEVISTVASDILSEAVMAKDFTI